jgi:hypothetical protein
MGSSSLYSSPSSGGRGGFLSGLFGGGRNGNGNKGNKPYSNNVPKPNPWAGLGGLGGFAPETPRPFSPETPKPFRPESPRPFSPEAPEEEASSPKGLPSFVPDGIRPKPGSNSGPWGFPKTENPSPNPVAAPEMGGEAMGEINRNTLWQPQVAEPFQIILSGEPDTNVKLMPDHVNIFDIDLFNTPASTIKELRRQNKKVICYFSAGSSEDWRPDYRRFSTSDKGGPIPKDDKGTSVWEGEKWLNIKNPRPNSGKLPNVWEIMRDRIKLAGEKGCDAIDPDNTGIYSMN